MPGRLESGPMKRKGHRQYDEREMGDILDRAAKLQGVTAMVPVHGGRTLDEIRSIAVEAGMDRSCVEAAVQSFHAEDQPRLPLVGRSPRMEFTSSFEGALDGEDRRQLLGVLQRALDAKGRTRETLDSVEWRHFGVLGRELVVLETHKGRTHLEVRGRYRRGFVATFLTGGLAGGFAAAGLLDLVGFLRYFDAWAVPLVLGAGLVAGRTMWGWFAAAKERMLRQLADRLAAIVEDNAEPRALPPRSED